MYAEAIQGLPDSHLDTVWEWFLALPERMKKQMHRECETQEEFQTSFLDDLLYLVFDNGLLGCVILEKRETGIYDVHLFCPRRTPSGKLREAIATFFASVKRDDRITKLVFSVRESQKRLEACIVDEGCRYTGWQFRERGETYRIFCKSNC